MRYFTRKSRYFQTPPKISIPFHNFHMWNMWKGLRGVDMEMQKPAWNGMEWIWIHIMDPYVDFVVWI
jgi:hypothetical protein